jgi:hypothetical protein
MTKRMLLFLFGCIGSRLLLVLVCKNLPLALLPFAGYIALLPAFGFAYLYITGTRKTGPEVFGEKIWWDSLRPVHSLLYFSFAISAIRKNRSSWTFLLFDVVLGLTSFLIYHFSRGDFNKIVL